MTVDGVLLKDGAFVANETGADVDCRIEGDTDVNLFYTDASTDRVGIGTATPATKLDVAGSLTVADNIIHSGDTNNLIAFATDTQDFQTGGSSRIDLSDSGVRLGGANARVTTVLDEDAMGTDSATALATQQSIKAYVDANAKNLEFVSTAAITAATTLTVTSFATGYDYYTQLEAYAPTDDAEVLWMRFSDDDGATYEAGAADYAWGGIQKDTHAFDVSDAKIILTANQASGNDAGNYSSIEVKIINPQGTSEPTTAVWDGFIMDETVAPITVQINGGGHFLQGAVAVDAVQFLWSGGSTFKAQGDITVWRRRRS